MVHFSGDEQEVRSAAAEVIAAWYGFRTKPYYREPPSSVRSDLEDLDAALDGPADTLADAVSNYLAGTAFWCDEPLKLAELHLRRVAYPLPDRAALRGCHPLEGAPLRTPRRPITPGISVMPFRPGPPPID